MKHLLCHNCSPFVYQQINAVVQTNCFKRETNKISEYFFMNLLLKLVFVSRFYSVQWLLTCQMTYLHNSHNTMRCLTLLIYNREIRYRRSWATDANRKTNVSFLAWFCSLPRTGKALADDFSLTLQTRWRENAPKREKLNFHLLSVAQKHLCLSSVMLNQVSAGWFYFNKKYFVCTTRKNMLGTNGMTLLPTHDFIVFSNSTSRALGSNATPWHDSTHGGTRPRFPWVPKCHTES